MSNENKTVAEKLKSLGFEQVEFEAKSTKRFIVYIDDIPPHVITSVNLPTYAGKWGTPFTVGVHNGIGMRLEESILNLFKKKEVLVKVCVLTSSADVDITWEISAVPKNVNFGNLNWEDDNKANIIEVVFETENVKISY